MTLRARIVAALLLAAIVPMVVVPVVLLSRAGRRAGEETARRVEQAGRRAKILLDGERASLAAAADRAASDLGASRESWSAVLRGPESVAAPVARTLAERYGIDRLSIRTAGGSVLAAFGPASRGVPLREEREVQAGGETLSLSAERDLDDAFAGKVAAIVGSPATLGPDPAACGEPRAELPAGGGATLCVAVPAADPRELRRDLVRTFAGTAPFAAGAALLFGLLLASRIARPIRTLTERASEISDRHAGPLSLLPESDETRRLTIAFDRMLDALAASERQRVAAERIAAWEEIARRLAHEVRNPLSPIQLAVENLRRTRERAPRELDRALEVETATILEEVSTLRRLVDEFAQFARLPRPSPEACDPGAIAAQALALYAGRIEAGAVRATLDVAAAPPSIRVDPAQVGRALKNVVQNALDAMEGSSERVLGVVVRASRGDEGAAGVAFEVRDTGPGFAPEALRQVFTPYFTTRGAAGGTGLGMAIAYRIVAEHGGAIRVAGAAGGGAVVTIVLPVGGPPPPSG